MILSVWHSLYCVEVPETAHPITRDITRYGGIAVFRVTVFHVPYTGRPAYSSRCSVKRPASRCAQIKNRTPDGADYLLRHPEGQLVAPAGLAAQSNPRSRSGGAVARRVAVMGNS